MKNSAQVVNDHKFSQVVNVDIQRSTFNRNSGKKTSFNAGLLVPVYIDEVLPGDTFDMKMSFVSRLTTPIYPTMDNLDLEFYAFYCPNRLVMRGWAALNGENRTSAWTPASPPSGVPFYSSKGPVESGSLWDYFGLPIGFDCSKYPISGLPTRVYYRIFDEWFRDQNFQAPTYDQATDTPVRPSGIPDYYKADSLLPVNKPHDYFSSCLPAPQKGSSQLIPISLNQLIPVITGSTKHGLLTLKGGSATVNNLSWALASDGSQPSTTGNIQYEFSNDYTNIDGSIGIHFPNNATSKRSHRENNLI